ncbi:EF-hand calcium-binding domain-containing protein 5, partial [Bienertia sinuspersici]
MENEVCLRFWHGGLFKEDRQGHMCYVGGQGKTFSIDADELCWWYLRDLVKNCGDYGEINYIYYLNPGKSLTEGLCKVYNDEEVRKMAEVVCKYRCVDLYVKHGEDINDLGVTQSIETSPAEKAPLSPSVTNERPKKLTLKRPPLCPARKSPRFKQPDDYDSQNQSTHKVSAVVVPPSTHEIPLSINQINSTPETTLPAHDNHNCNANTPHITTLICSETPIATDTITTTVPEDYEWEENRPDSPIPWQDLLGPDHSSDYDTNSDPDFIPSVQKEGEIESGSEGESWEADVVDEGQHNDSEASLEDGEDTAVQDEGVDISDEEYHSVRDKVRGFNNNIFEVAQKLQRDAQEGNGYASDYNESEEDVDTPTNSGEDEAVEVRQSRRRLLISPNTDFGVFQWQVGQRFASRGDFKQAVAKVGIFQGRDLGISISDKKRQQRLGVQCSKGCPFRIYASWDTRRACFVVKRVSGEHTCVRNMERNKQLKTGWMAKQLLEVFKARPHWPAKEIIECIRLGYRVMVKKGFAYKVKYRAHKMLHGSMKDHYNKAILNGVASVFPLAEHRHCARHVFALWHKTYRGDEMKIRFWKIVKSYNIADYTEALEELKEVDHQAAIVFQSYNPKVFCRAFLSTTCKSDVITNNMAETFNGYIINARNKHLIYMLEDIRVALMQRLVQKREEMEKCTSALCPRLQQKLEKEKEEAAKCTVLPSTSTLFQVNHNLDSLTVDLKARTCTCRKWDMCGVPCCHAIAAVFFCHRNAEELVQDCYHKSIYLKAYSGAIPPLSGERHWPRVQLPLDPPPIKIGPGRTRKNRIKDPFENPKKSGKLSKHGIEMTCTICKRKGHNKRRCPTRGTIENVQPQQKRPRGRPRKPDTAPQTTLTPQSLPESQQHHETTAQPSRLGKGGRVVGGSGRGASRRGSAGRGSGRGSGDDVGRGGSGRGSGRGSVRGSGDAQGRVGSGGRRGRGRGRNTLPQGHGVLFTSDGVAMTNVPQSLRGPTLVGE